ncbi:MAG: hypothetical protein ABID45_00045 [Patescibacteria group bacterium]
MPKKETRKLNKQVQNKRKQVKKRLEDSKEKIETGLKGIYQNEKGEKVDMTKLDRKNPKKKVWNFLGVFLLIIAVISALIGGYFLIQDKFSKEESNKAEINIVIPEKSSSGDLLEFEVEIINKETVDISEGVLSIHYPEGFYFKESDIPTREGTDNAWDLEDISASTTETITIKGQLVGEKGATKSFNALLIYKPANFNSEFQASASASTVLTSSVISLDIDVPQQVRTGEQFEYNITFENTSEYVLQNGKVVIDYPDDFTLVSADPDFFSNNNIWMFEEIDSGEKETIKITGVLNSEAGKTEEFKFQFGLVEPNGEFNPQVEKISLVLVTNPEISMELKGAESASAGEDLNYTLEVKNTSEVDLSDLEFEVEFTGDATKQSKMTLDKIDELGPNKTRKITFENTVKNNIDENVEEITAIVYVSSAKVDGKNVNLEMTSELKTSLIGGIDLYAYGRYYKNDLTKIGDGPLPPKVGKKTTYVIFWTYTTKGSQLKDIIIETTLPDDVKYEGDATSGVSYDSKNHKVSFEVDLASPEDLEQKIDFSVSVTPKQSDINKLLILQEKAILTATDVNTDQTLTQESDKITTDLEEDDGAEGKGVVEG